VFAGHAVLALGAPAVGHAERTAVDPGRVEVVDDADVELAAGGRLFGGELDRAAEPDVADGRRRAFAPGRPGADPRARLPGAHAGIAPRLGAATGGAVPLLPERGEGGDGGERVFAEAVEQGHLRFAVKRRAGFAGEPGADLRTAPAGMDRTHGNIQGRAKA